MRFTTSSVIFAICTAVSFFGQASAVPVQLGARDVFNPKILFPNGGERFHSGETILVRWDTSELPAGLTNEGMIVLAKPTNGSENLSLQNPLATNFLLTDGQHLVTFPRTLPTADNYAIVLFGDSGNISNEFTIKAPRKPDY